MRPKKIRPPYRPATPAWWHPEPRFRTWDVGEAEALDAQTLKEYDRYTQAFESEHEDYVAQLLSEEL